MKVLLDECVPQLFAELLTGHSVKTVPEVGWPSIKNGALLKIAATQFDVLITVDKKMADQHDASVLQIPVIILSARSTQLKHLKPLTSKVIELLNSDLPPNFYILRG